MESVRPGKGSFVVGTLIVGHVLLYPGLTIDSPVPKDWGSNMVAIWEESRKIHHSTALRLSRVHLLGILVANPHSCQ